MSGSEQVDPDLRRAAFGITLSIDPRISIPGIGNDHSAAMPPSRVRLDEGELSRRWGEVDTVPIRVRELRIHGALVLSVDFAEPPGYLLWTRDFGRVLVSPDGLDVLCDPDGAVADWSSILAAQALPLASTLRGFELFHASGVVLDGEAVIVAGGSGTGKTSIAAALVRAGAQLLSDDAVALRLSGDGIVAHAGSVVLQLRAAEDRLLSPSERTILGRAAFSSTGKRTYVGDAIVDSAPLGRLFLIERSNEKPAVEAVSAVDPFELIASTFNLSVRTPARLQRQLDVVAAIASRDITYRLRVQDGVNASRLASVVRSQLNETGL